MGPQALSTFLAAQVSSEGKELAAVNVCSRGDVRVLAATNRDLNAAVDEGGFRSLRPPECVSYPGPGAPRSRP